MAYETIISCPDLFAHLNDKDWVIVDCRFDLADADWGETEYRELHIPGAVYADINKDLSSPITPESGRHPLPDPERFHESMTRLGVRSDTQVIAYDATSGSFAARLWFLLRMYGHNQVAVLDGGFSEWMKLGLPFSSGMETNPPGNFLGTPHMERIVSTHELEQVYTQPDWLLIDSRAPERYSGKSETIDVKAGHIPGAVNHFYGLNIDPNGLFFTPAKLRQQFLTLLKDFPPEKTIIYCGSGVTSAHNLLAMAIAGLPQPKLYNGSWSEWIRDPNHPIIQKETSW